MIDQIAIAILGVSAIWFSQGSNVTGKKWAPVLGLSSQPFWFYSAYDAQQWGIVVLCVFYTVAWGRGVIIQWFTQPKEVT